MAPVHQQAMSKAIWDVDHDFAYPNQTPSGSVFVPGEQPEPCASLGGFVVHSSPNCQTCAGGGAVVVVVAAAVVGAAVAAGVPGGDVTVDVIVPGSEHAASETASAPTAASVNMRRFPMTRPPVRASQPASSVSH